MFFAFSSDDRNHSLYIFKCERVRIRFEIVFQTLLIQCFIHKTDNNILLFDVLKSFNISIRASWVPNSNWQTLIGDKLLFHKNATHKSFINAGAAPLKKNRLKTHWKLHKNGILASVWSNCCSNISNYITASIWECPKATSSCHIVRTNCVELLFSNCVHNSTRCYISKTIISYYFFCTYIYIICIMYSLV